MEESVTMDPASRDALRLIAFGASQWPRFERYARGARIGWNWGAFFCSFAEFVRWRRPGLAFVNLLFLLAGAAASLYFAVRAGSWLFYAGYALATYLVLPVLFDYLVFLRVEQEIDDLVKSGGTQEEIASRIRAACNPRPVGRVSDVMTWIAGFGLGVLLPYTMQASIDFMLNFQFRDTMKIAEYRLRSFHQQHKRLPIRGEMEDPKASDVVHMRQEWDEERGALKVWLKTTVVEDIEARFVLRPEIDSAGKLVRVQCFNVSIPPRWLPANCKESWR